MSLLKQKFDEKKKEEFNKLQKNLKKKNNTVTYQDYENFQKQIIKKKVTDQSSAKSQISAQTTASDTKTYFMNFQRTDINEPENIYYFKRASNPEVNYFHKNKNMNVFQNHIPSASYNNIKQKIEQEQIQSQSVLQEKELDAIQNFRIKKFTEFFKNDQNVQDQRSKNSNDSSFLKKQYNSYLDQHCIKQLIKNIKTIKQKQGRSYFQFDKMSKNEKIKQQKLDTRQIYQKSFENKKIEEKKLKQEMNQIQEESINDDLITNNLNASQNNIEEPQQLEKKEENDQEINQNQDENVIENPVIVQNILRRQLSDNISILSNNSQINEQFDYRFIPDYICNNRLKPRYSINYTTAYMSQFYKDPTKKDVLNNQTLQKQVNHEMNQTFKQLNEQTISQIDVPTKVFPYKTTNQYFYPPHEIKDQMLHFKFSQPKPYHKGMQSTTSNRFQYLIPENANEARGPNCPQFQEIMEQRVLNDLKFDHQTSYIKDFYKKKNNPQTSNPLPPVQQETMFFYQSQISSQKRQNVL